VDCEQDYEWNSEINPVKVIGQSTVYKGEIPYHPEASNKKPDYQSNLYICNNSIQLYKKFIHFHSLFF
jgi:hypothetical protein